MNKLNIGDNITRLRHSKGVTQEALADFVGVTKGSVSKWENHQSMPDVSLLPLLAAFFDISIDGLIGYEAQLDREQIRKIYQELAADFATNPFEEVMDKSRKLVKQYYSCYSFLFQISLLWLNHFMLAGSSDVQQKVLGEARGLCRHICNECKETALTSDAVMLQAYIDLQLGRAEDVIEALEETISPYRMTGRSEGVLIQAYILAGETEKAVSYTQFAMFGHLISLVGHAITYLELHQTDLPVCEETIRRVDQLDTVYQFAVLDGNAAAIYQMQAACVYARHGMEEQAMERLGRYVSVIRWMFTEENLTSHGDAYFDRIRGWYEGCDLGNRTPRSRKVILDSAAQIFDYPVFDALKARPDFRKLRQSVKEIRA